MLAPFIPVFYSPLRWAFFDFVFIVLYTDTMKKFSYVEEYLEVINGDRDPASGKIYGLFDSTSPIVSLARYDVQVLASMSAATQSGRALTDRQAELAVKIILKYRKQLEKLDIDVSPVETPQYRLGIRTIDRRRLLYIEDDRVVLKFPYETKLIDDLRDLAKISQGAWAFDSGNRAWRLAITETNIVAAHGFAENHQFEIADEFKSYFQAIINCEQIPYEIKLVESDSGFVIENAANSLTQAVNDYCGFDRSNRDWLVDNSPIYGYTVDESIVTAISAEYSPRICNLMLAHESKFKPDSDSTVLKDVVHYAETTGRYPIYVYEPDMSSRLYKNFVEQYFGPDDIYCVQKLKSEESLVHKKVIYFNKYTAGWNQPVPLLISGQGMMHGGEKSLLLQRAEKIVYFATEVYNNKSKKY